MELKVLNRLYVEKYDDSFYVEENDCIIIWLKNDVCVDCEVMKINNNSLVVFDEIGETKEIPFENISDIEQD